MMTRKDYQGISAAIFEVCKAYMSWNVDAGEIAEEIAKYMTGDNPRFNREKFLEASLGNKYGKE